jgi:hypothetical protein
VCLLARCAGAQADHTGMSKGEGFGRLFLIRDSHTYSRILIKLNLQPPALEPGQESSTYFEC